MGTIDFEASFYLFFHQLRKNPNIQKGERKKWEKRCDTIIIDCTVHITCRSNRQFVTYTTWYIYSIQNGTKSFLNSLLIPNPAIISQDTYFLDFKSTAVHSMIKRKFCNWAKRADFRKDLVPIVLRYANSAQIR